MASQMTGRLGRGPACGSACGLAGEWVGEFLGSSGRCPTRAAAAFHGDNLPHRSVEAVKVRDTHFPPGQPKAVQQGVIGKRAAPVRLCDVSVRLRAAPFRLHAVSVRLHGGSVRPQGVDVEKRGILAGSGPLKIKRKRPA